MDVREATDRVLEAGKSGELIAAFRNVAEVTTPLCELKYPPKVCRDLAKAIVCRNYAKSVLQLCHLVNAADACGRGRESYERFFFGGLRAIPRNFMAATDNALAGRGWRRAGFECGGEGIVIRYKSSVFNVAYSRMPMLTALLDFLIGIESYTEVDAVLSEMLSDCSDDAAVKKAANTISRHIYRYLSRHLPSAQNAAKFNHILKFLKNRSTDRSILIDDATVLEFWSAHGDVEDGRSGDFRAFRTVLDAFVAFQRALELAEDHAAVQRAAPVGSDREAGEIDSDGLSGTFEVLGQWESPLPLLAEEPVTRIKLLTNREKGSLQLLLELGPMSRRLPLSLLRAEVFGSVQSRITQALRRKADRKDMTDLICCTDADGYTTSQTVYADLRARIGMVMKAALHVLLRDRRMTDAGNVAVIEPEDLIAIFERLIESPGSRDPEGLGSAIEDAGKAFRSISRKGFAESELDDPDLVEGFRSGAGILLAIAQEIDGFLDTMKHIDQNDPKLVGWFQRDVEYFRARFERLYGATP